MSRPNQHWRCDNCQWSHWHQPMALNIDYDPPKPTPCGNPFLQCRAALPAGQKVQWPDVKPDDWCRYYEPDGNQSQRYDFQPVLSDTHGSVADPN